MNINAKTPVFVPAEYRAEIEELSKAALMDVVWDYCLRFGGFDPLNAIESFRQTREIIESYRK